MIVIVATERRYPVGAELIGDNETHFRVWAPKATQLEVALESGKKSAPASFHPLEAEGGGYFSGSVEVGAESRYRFRIDGGGVLYPEPASRYQPEGPHGPSVIVDPTQFQWKDANWSGCDLK